MNPPVVPTIEPYAGPLAGCRKCGNGEQTVHVPGMGPLPGDDPRISHIVQVSPRFAAAGFHPSTLRVRYCPGGKELEEETSEPMVQLLQQFIGTVSDKFRGLNVKRLNICAGITEEHLHIICVDCGHEWLTQTKEQAR